MKLILSSDGLSGRKLKEAFLKMLTKRPKDISVLIIAGILKKRHLKYISKVKRQLVSMGISSIKIADISKNIHAKNFSSFDIIFFMGGNTFYLLNRTRKTGFVPFIKKHIKQGKIYLGVSAGSIIVHKTIEIAGWGVSADPNLIGLQDLRGIGVTNIAIFPHYKRKNKKELNSFKRNSSYTIKEIRDGEAVLIEANKIKIIRR